jgi:hypothetical protein
VGGNGTGIGGNFNTNMMRDPSYGSYPADYQGLLAAITLSGAFSINDAGLGGFGGGTSASNGYPGSAGAVLLYFT